MENIVLKKEDLNSLMYFIISMFQNEDNHIQLTSSKNDLIGGYIDRWINKIPEDIIFNKYLLKDKNYSVINDYFIYNSTTDKNAPDILGIKTSNGTVIKFVEFKNDTWSIINNSPYIEVKTFRKNQNFILVRETQLNDDSYYVFVESDFKEDYLINFFDLSIFNEKIYEKIIMDDKFIVDNQQNSIKQPHRINLQDEIGSLKLISVIKGSDYKLLSTKFDSDNHVYYVTSVEEVENVRGKKEDGRKFSEVFNYDEYKKAYCGMWHDNIIIPIVAKNIEDLKIIKENKQSFYCVSKEECYLDDVKSNTYNIKPNKYYRVKLGVFPRTSNWTEYIVPKSQLPSTIDKSEELVRLFDDIVKGCNE